MKVGYLSDTPQGPRDQTRNALGIGQGTLDCVDRHVLRQKLSSLLGQIGSEIWRRCSHFTHDFRPTGQDADDVLEVMAGEKIEFSPTGKGFPLRSQEDRRGGNQDHEPLTEVKRSSLSQSGLVPPIRKTQDVTADRHHVERKVLWGDPSADRCSLAHVVPQPEGAEFLFDLAIPEASRSPHDDVDIGCWANARCATGRDQELRDLASNKDDLAKKRLDPPCHRLECSPVQ